MTKRKVGIAYIPVLHRGYFDLLELFQEEGVEKVYVISDEILTAHDGLDYINRKDRLRALPHDELLKILSHDTDLEFFSLTLPEVQKLQGEDIVIHTPKEDINTFIIATYFEDKEVVYHNVFLRWNRENIETQPDVAEMNISDFQKSTFALILEEAQKSTDWWRQVGAALVKGGEVISVAHNEHMPDEELPNVYGDARSLYKKGININYVTSAHAEIGVIAEAARKGIETEGAELFLTDFPCPYCARLVAKAGISKVYYLKGYGVLDGEDFLKSMGVETIKVGGIKKADA